MAKLEVKTFAKAKTARSKPSTVKKKTIRQSGGETMVVRAIDAHSNTFADDFLYVFKRNVQAARKENKTRVGSGSGIKPKS